MRIRLSFVAAALIAPVIAAPAASAEEPPASRDARHPTPKEMLDLIEREWRSYRHVIRDQQHSNDTPSDLLGVAGVLCSNEPAQYFRCASLVEYSMPSGHRRSSLIVHTVERDERGRLNDAIVIRELPPSR